MSIWREIEDEQAAQQRKSLSEDEILQVMHWILKDEEWPFIWGRDTKEMVCCLRKLLMSTGLTYPKIILRSEFSSEDEMELISAKRERRMISCSPSERYQLWLINYALFLFSDAEMWFVYKDVLFDDGELDIHNVKWNEEKMTVSFILEYLVGRNRTVHEYSFEGQNLTLISKSTIDME